jgi:hypothetical protein
MSRRAVFVRRRRVLFTFSVASMLVFMSRLKVMVRRSLTARGNSMVMLA